MDRLQRVTETEFGRSVEYIDLPVQAEQLRGTGQLGGAGEYSLGSRADYQFFSVPTANEIQYTRTEVPKKAFTKVRTFLHAGGVSGATVKFGIYSEVNGQPAAKLAEKLVVISGADNDKIVEVTLDAPYVPTAYGPLWLAVLVTSAVPQFISTDTLLAGFHSIFFQQTVDGNLPANATPVADNATAIFAALVE